MPHLLQDHRQSQTIFLYMKIGKTLHIKVNHSPFHIDQQIYEARSEIITTLIDCFSELNKYTSSHPETELACHQEKTRHFSYYSWLIQHIDNVLQEDNIFRHGKELPELPAPTYSPSVTDLEMIQRIHVMSHAWRESDQALQEATIIHREFMLEQAHMNNTSFSRIRNMDHITDMGYSLNRVSPHIRRTTDPCAVPQTLEILHQHPDVMRDTLIKLSVPQGADTQQGGRVSPYDPDHSVENHLRGQAAGSDNQTQGAQAPTTNTINNNNQIQFQNTQRHVTSTTGPTGQCVNRYSQPSNKGPGKKASSHTITQPFCFRYFRTNQCIPAEQELRGQVTQSCSAQPVVNTTIGERIAPMIVIVTIVTVIHMLPTCVGHPQNLLLPHPPQPVICIYCGSSEHRSMECRKLSLRQQRGRVVYPVQHLVGTPVTNNVNLPRRLAEVHKNLMLGPDIVTNLGTTHRDQQQADNNSNSHNAPHRANQILIQNFPYRDYRYSDQPRQTRFNEKQNQMYSPYHCAPSPALSAGSDLLSPFYYAACRNAISFS